MPIPIILPAYAGLLAILFVVLAGLVIRTRGRVRVAIGTGGDRTLERAYRVHANFAEYVPLALILIGFVEMHRWSSWLVHLLCLVLLVGRASHAYGVSQDPENFTFRMVGMISTFAAILVPAVLLLLDGLRF